MKDKLSHSQASESAKQMANKIAKKYTFDIIIQEIASDVYDLYDAESGDVVNTISAVKKDAL